MLVAAPSKVQVRMKSLTRGHFAKCWGKSMNDKKVSSALCAATWHRRSLDKDLIFSTWGKSGKSHLTTINCVFLLYAVSVVKFFQDDIAGYVSYKIWGWVNTYRYIFSGMNIHLPAILGFTRYQGFDTSPYDYSMMILCTVSQLYHTFRVSNGSCCVTSQARYAKCAAKMGMQRPRWHPIRAWCFPQNITQLAERYSNSNRCHGRHSDFPEL